MKQPEVIIKYVDSFVKLKGTCNKHSTAWSVSKQPYNRTDTFKLTNNIQRGYDVKDVDVDSHPTTNLISNIFAALKEEDKFGMKTKHQNALVDGPTW